MVLPIFLVKKEVTLSIKEDSSILMYLVFVWCKVSNNISNIVFVGNVGYQLFFLRFKPLQPKVKSEKIVCWENTALFTLSIYQYIALAIAFSTSAPYRKPLFTNCEFN